MIIWLPVAMPGKYSRLFLLSMQGCTKGTTNAYDDFEDT